VGFLFSYVTPLVFVLLVTLFKEAIEDIYRYKQDKKTNLEEYTMLEIVDGEYEKRIIKSEDIRVGDLIELHQNQRIPADMIALKSYTKDDNMSSSGNIFIRTDQLDGETDWKLRKAPAITQNLSSLDEMINCAGMIYCDPPGKMIYDFKGVLHFNQGDPNGNSLDSIYQLNESSNRINNQISDQKESLSLENTLWSSTILASKKVVGIVIYTGIETRARMNSSGPKSKFGLLDLEINNLVKILAVIMFLSAFIVTALKGFHQNFEITIVTFFRFIVLFCAIIPIALSVNLDISKTFNSRRINKDDDIKDSIVRNSTIPEELGRISYVFTDKTGTLTKNEMIFKYLCLETEEFSETSLEDLTMILQDECNLHDAPMIDLVHLQMKSAQILEQQLSPSLLNESNLSNEFPARTSRSSTTKRIRRNRNKVIRDAIEAMTICNNVKPIIETNTQGEQEINYQASSPDEVALVKFSESINMRLIYRTDKEIKIKNAVDCIEEFEILNIFPFSSDTKRMGIIVRNKKYNHIIFYLKGAESVMENLIKPEYRSHILENAENLASIGLRTLVLSQKLMDENQYREWNKEYLEATTVMENRKEKIAEVVQRIEKDMDFLCVTGVEDLLQDEVDITIENLRKAGMKIWMLTGDKIETATCITISAGIKSKDQKFFYIRSDNIDKSPGIYSPKKHTEYLKEELNKFISNLNINSYVLIIDGDSLEIAINQFEKEFFEVARKVPSVVCCRCSPTQKSKVVKAMRKYTKGKRCCAIGDGGNDVAMIQESDVGIGIVGKEGLQASLAADFSITKFKHLNGLILWHGRLSYKNTATICKFIIHRGLIISLIQFIFSIIFYCSPVPIYNGTLILGYSSIYTNIPVFSLLLDQDTERKHVMKYPLLYLNLLQGRELSIKVFLWWFWKSLFQAFVLMIGAIFIFGNILFLKFATVTFTSLIFTELLMVYTEIKTFHRYMIIAILSTLIVYLASLIFLKEILDVSYIFDFYALSKVFLLTLLSWLPFYICYKCKTKCYPETHEKLNEIEI